MTLPPVVQGRVLGPIELGFWSSVDSAEWLTPADLAGVLALGTLAEMIDQPQPDPKDRGMLISRFLKGCDVYGLSPFGRGKLIMEDSDDDDPGDLISLVGGRAS